MNATRRAPLILCAATAALLHSGAATLLPPFPTAAAKSPGDPDPLPAPDGLTMTAAFSNAADRAYWDLPLAGRIPDNATSLEITFSCPDPTPLRSLSLHLRSGRGWHACPLPIPARPRQTFCLPLALFQPEDDPAAIHKATALRLSAWRRAAGSATIILHSLQTRADRAAVVRATESSAPGEPALATALAGRCSRLLDKAGIPHTVIGDSFDRLDSFELLLLPYSPALPQKSVRRLARFANRGGRLIVFYNPSQPLGAVAGVSPGPWQGAPAGQEWSGMACDTDLLPGAAARVPHTTNSALPPFAAGASGTAIAARLIDNTGRATDTPACAVSDRAAWFAHVPPLATPAAVSLLRSVIARLAPDLATATPTPPDQPPSERRPGEIRAAWHTGPGARHPKGWNGLMPLLASNAVNTIFVHWQTAGQDRFTLNQPADSPASAVAAGRRHGVSVHAWVTCWTTDGLPADLTARLSREGRLMRAADGSELPWLCPSLPQNRDMLISGMRTMLKLGVDGIHLDYVRYPERQGCYAPATRRAFEELSGSPVSGWPADVLAGGPRAAEFDAFRSKVISDFMRQAREAVRAQNPDALFTAAVFPTPAAAAACGQAWPEWLSQSLADAICPMIYTEDPRIFAALLDDCLRAAPACKARLIPGIGVSADESQADAASAAGQISAARRRGLPGFAFFALDDALLYQTLPAIFGTR